MSGSVVAVTKWGSVISYMSFRTFGESAIEQLTDGIGRGCLHIPAYVVLTLLVTRLVTGGAARRVPLAFVIATAYGTVLETLQVLSPARSALDSVGRSWGRPWMPSRCSWRMRETHLVEKMLNWPAASPICVLPNDSPGTVAVFKLWSRRLHLSCDNAIHMSGPLSEPRDCSLLAWSRV